MENNNSERSLTGRFLNRLRSMSPSIFNNNQTERERPPPMAKVTESKTSAPPLSPQHYGSEALNKREWSAVTSPGFSSRIARLAERDTNSPSSSRDYHQSPFELSPNRNLGLGQIPSSKWKSPSPPLTPFRINSSQSSNRRISLGFSRRDVDVGRLFLRIAPLDDAGLGTSRSTPELIENKLAEASSLGLGGIRSPSSVTTQMSRLWPSKNNTYVSLSPPPPQSPIYPNLAETMNRKRNRNSDQNSDSPTPTAIMNGASTVTPGTSFQIEDSKSKRFKFLGSGDNVMTNSSLASVPLTNYHNNSDLSSESILEQMNQTEKRFLPDDDNESSSRLSKRQKGNNVTSSRIIQTPVTSVRKRKVSPHVLSLLNEEEVESRGKAPKLCNCIDCYNEAAGMPISTTPSIKESCSTMPNSTSNMEVLKLSSGKKRVTFNPNASEKKSEDVPDRISLQQKEADKTADEAKAKDILQKTKDALAATAVIDREKYLADKKKRESRLRKILEISENTSKIVASNPPPATPAIVEVNNAPPASLLTFGSPTKIVASNPTTTPPSTVAVNNNAPPAYTLTFESAKPAEPSSTLNSSSNGTIGFSLPSTTSTNSINNPAPAFSFGTSKPPPPESITSNPSITNASSTLFTMPTTSTIAAVNNASPPSLLTFGSPKPPESISTSNPPSNTNTTFSLPTTASTNNPAPVSGFSFGTSKPPESITSNPSVTNTSTSFTMPTSTIAGVNNAPPPSIFSFGTSKPPEPSTTTNAAVTFSLPSTTAINAINNPAPASMFSFGTSKPPPPESINTNPSITNTSTLFTMPTTSTIAGVNNAPPPSIFSFGASKPAEPSSISIPSTNAAITFSLPTTVATNNPAPASVFSFGSSKPPESITSNPSINNNTSTLFTMPTTPNIAPVNNAPPPSIFSFGASKAAEPSSTLNSSSNNNIGFSMPTTTSTNAFNNPAAPASMFTFGTSKPPESKPPTGFGGFNPSNIFGGGISETNGVGVVPPPINTNFAFGSGGGGDGGMNTTPNLAFGSSGGGMMNPTPNLAFGSSAGGMMNPTPNLVFGQTQPMGGSPLLFTAGPSSSSPGGDIRRPIKRTTRRYR